jgi:uncharacterized protein
MKQMIARMLLLLLLSSLGGCLLSPPSPAAKSAHTRSLEKWYPDKGAQALAVAAELGDVVEVQRLMKQEGVNPDRHFSPEGMPLLAWPIFTGNSSGLKAMLDNGANPNAAKLHSAQNSPRFRGRHENNAMVWASMQTNPIYLQYLLDHGGNPNTRNSNNETLLFQAFIWQNQWQNVQLLVERGADVNAESQAYPIISNYAMNGDFKRVYWLLEHGANPDNKGSNKSTLNAIFWKAMEGEGLAWQIKCQQWVLAHGFKRPFMPEHYRRDRAAFGFETDESKVPLPEVKEVTP